MTSLGKSPKGRYSIRSVMEYVSEALADDTWDLGRRWWSMTRGLSLMMLEGECRSEIAL